MVYNTLKENFKHFEIICVDDGCDQATMERVRATAAAMRGAEMTVMHTGRCQGLEKAMIAGMDFAIGDYVFEFDSTVDSYEPGLIMDVYYKALEGNDIVGTVPEAGSKAMSKMFYAVINRSANLPYPLNTETFRVISRRAINRIYDVNKKIIFRKVAYATSGLRCEKVTYTPKDSAKAIFDREQKRNRWDTGIDAVVLYTDVAFRFSMMCSLLFALFALCMLLYTIGVFLLGHPIEGWTTTMLLISLAFLGVFLMLTCMAKYLSLIIRLQVSRREFTFESIEKVTR